MDLSLVKSESMSRLNVAVWGLGNHAKNRILPTLAAIDEIKLLGVCSRNDTTVAEIAEQWGC
jgi:predicted dehydrogenase